MNTGIRRFILRLAVGLLAFLLGVTAVWALGGLNPFQNFSGSRYYKHKRCGSYRSWNAPRPAFEWHASTDITQPVYIGPLGCKTEKLGKLPPLPEAPAMPALR
jgi:hypothetical protein